MKIALQGQQIQQLTPTDFGIKAKLKPAAKVVAHGWNFSTPLQIQAHTYSATTLAAGFNFSRCQALE
jgi:hypothetical protein